MREDAPFFKMNCPACGAGLELDLDNLISFCPYCGGKLLVDPVAFKDVLIEKERTKRIEMKYSQEDKKRAAASRRRLWKVKASIALAAIGIPMTIVGHFAGEASGNPDSSWFFVSMLGLFPLMFIPHIWLFDLNTSETRDGENK